MLKLKGTKVLFGNFVWVLALRGVQQGAALIGFYFLARGLDKATFGNYGLFLSFVAVCAAVLTFPGLNGAIVQCTARGESQVYHRALRLALMGGLGGSGALAAVSAVLHGSHPELARGLLVAAAVFPLSHGLLQWRSIYSGKEHFAALFWLEGLSAIGIYSLMVLGVLTVPGEMLVPVSCVLLVPASINLVMTIKTLREVPKGADKVGGVAYGLKTSFYLILNTLANHLDKFLIFFLFSAEMAALYVVAQRVPELVKGVVQDLAVVLAPRFARLSGFTKQLDQQLWILSLTIMVIVIGLTFTLLPWLVVVVFSDTYTDAVPIAQGLMISVAIGNHATLRYRYVTSKLDAESVRDVTMATSVVRLASSALLVPLFGLWGAVAAAIVYRILTGVIVYTVVRLRHGTAGRLEHEFTPSD